MCDMLVMIVFEYVFEFCVVGVLCNVIVDL